MSKITRLKTRKKEGANMGKGNFWGKKIALLLIIFMAGTWSAYGQSSTTTEDDGSGTILLAFGAAILIGLGIWGIVALIGGEEAGDEFGEFYFGQAVPEGTVTGPKAASFEGTKSQPETKSTVFDHLMLESDGESVYTGLRFQF